MRVKRSSWAAARFAIPQETGSAVVIVRRNPQDKFLRHVPLFVKTIVRANEFAKPRLRNRARVTPGLTCCAVPPYVQATRAVFLAFRVPVWCEFHSRGVSAPGARLPVIASPAAIGTGAVEIELGYRGRGYKRAVSYGRNRSLEGRRKCLLLAKRAATRMGSAHSRGCLQKAPESGPLWPGGQGTALLSPQLLPRSAGRRPERPPHPKRSGCSEGPTSETVGWPSR